MKNEHSRKLKTISIQISGNSDNNYMKEFKLWTIMYKNIEKQWKSDTEKFSEYIWGTLNKFLLKPQIIRTFLAVIPHCHDFIACIAEHWIHGWFVNFDEIKYCYFLDVFPIKSNRTHSIKIISDHNDEWFI